MKKKRLWWVLAIVAVVACVVWFGVVPRVIQVSAIRALEDAGFTGAALTVHVPGARGARVSGLHAASDSLVIDANSIEVAYSLRELCAGRVRSITGDGVSLALKSGAPKKDEGDEAPFDPAELPFDEVVLSNAVFTMVTTAGTQDYRAPYLRLQNLGGGRFAAAGACSWIAQFGSNDITATSGSLSCEGTVQRIDTRLGFALDIRTEDLDASSRALGFEVADLKGTVPLRLNVSADEEAERPMLTAGRIQWQDLAVSAVTATVSVTESHLLCDVLTTVPESLDGSGLVAVRNGKLVFGEKGVEPHGQVVLLNVAASDPRLDARVEGLSAVIHVDYRDGRLVPEYQTVTVGELTFGDLHLSDGSIEFQTGANNSVHVRSVFFTWAGGRIGCRDLLLSPDTPAADLKLELERLELEQVLGFVAAGRATGKGRLSGHWNLGIAWGPKPGIHFGAGQLTPEGGGWFKIYAPEDAKALLDLRGGGIDGELQAKIQRAMYDFEYDTLSVAFEDRDPGLTARVKLVGRGPRGDKPVRFGGLNLNINGLDSVLRPLILRSQATRGQLQSALEEALGNAYGGGKTGEPEKKAEEKALDDAIDAYF